MQTKDEFWFSILRNDDTGKFRHEEVEVIFILRGSGRLFFERENRIHTIKEKDIFVINSFQMHALELNEDALAIALMLSPGFLMSMNSEIMSISFDCRSFLYPENKQEKFDVLRREFARTFRTQYKNGREDSICLRSRVLVLLDKMLHLFAKQETNTGRAEENQWLRQITDYIHRNYREKITLQDLAENTYLSTTYISHCFRKYFRMSFTEYVMQVRFFHAAVLLYGNATITDAALESGFPNVNAMISCFKRLTGMTPGEYRKKYRSTEGETDRESLKSDSGEDVFEGLMKYAGEEEQDAEVANKHETIRDVQADLLGGYQKIPMHWKRMISAGYASDLLEMQLQEEIRQIQKTIGFTYIRIKGVLDDDMFVYRQDMNGAVVINFTYLDKVIDFILSVGAKPMLELGHIPRLLAEDPDNTFSMRRTIQSVPADMEGWASLLKQVMEHLAGRYGTARLQQWLFAPWVFPEFVEQKELEWKCEETYRIAYEAVKAVSKDIPVYGPGCTVWKKTLPRYLSMCRSFGCMPEIIAVRSFFAVNPDEKRDGLKLIANNESPSMTVTGDEDYLAHSLDEIRKILRDFGAEDLPVILDELNSNIWQRDLCNDTCYKSAFLFKNILEYNVRYHGFAYFAVNDQLKEVSPEPETFHGGFGLFTQNGLPKAVYRAYELLAAMGNRCIRKGEGYFIAESEEEIQIYLYNYCHYDLLYRYRHKINMTKTERYNVFVNKDTCVYNIRLFHAEPGIYLLQRYSVGPSGGSAYDVWAKMGAPEPISQEERSIIERLSYPLYRTEKIVLTDAEEPLTVWAEVIPHEVQLIKIRKIG